MDGFVRTSDIKCRSEYERVRKAVQQDELVRVKRGVYATPMALADTMIDVEAIVPSGVLCLYSAWVHYGIGTHVPAAYCVAIEAKRKVKLPQVPAIELYYWKNENLTFGIVQEEVGGYRVRITDLERSVCDAVKYRNKIGIDLCAQIVKDYLRRPDRNLTRLNAYASRLRVQATLSKYLEIAL